jgi:hypothetical protein
MGIFATCHTLVIPRFLTSPRSEISSKVNPVEKSDDVESFADCVLLNPPVPVTSFLCGRWENENKKNEKHERRDVFHARIVVLTDIMVSRLRCLSARWSERGEMECGRRTRR